MPYRQCNRREAAAVVFLSLFIYEALWVLVGGLLGLSLGYVL